MSPRAAARLEHLGFTEVYHYQAGKADWMASNLPWDGSAGPWACDAVTPMPTCRLDERLGDVRRRLGDVACVVVDRRRVVHGTLEPDDLQPHPDARASEVMTLGPVTVRPSEWLPSITRRMREHEVDHVLVTLPDGRLLGALRRADAERVLREREADDSGRDPTIASGPGGPCAALTR